MYKIMVAILALGVLAACDNGPTGPTASGGEITLETFESSEYTDKDTGEGYYFATGKVVTITPYTNNINEIDIYAFPARTYPYDVMVCASNLRIYINGSPTEEIYLKFGESADFELLTVSREKKYKVYVQIRKIGFDAKRGGRVSETILRYQVIE